MKGGRIEGMWVLVETSLSTHIVMPVSPHTTAADLKRELGNEHPICFPSIGVIEINGLTVKRGSCYYHLPDSIPVKDVFQGSKGNWFLHVDATPSDHPGLAVCGKPGNHVTCEFKLNTEEDKAREECNPKNKQAHVDGREENKTSCPSVSMSVSEAASVAGLIRRYFPEYDEVQSHRTDESGSFRNKPQKKKKSAPPQLVSFPSPSGRSSRKFGRSEVGKRVLQAAGNCASQKKSPITTICQTKSRKFDKTLVFEISDSVG